MSFQFINDIDIFTVTLTKIFKKKKTDLIYLVGRRLFPIVGVSVVIQTTEVDWPPFFFSCVRSQSFMKKIFFWSLAKMIRENKLERIPNRSDLEIGSQLMRYVVYMITLSLTIVESIKVGLQTLGNVRIVYSFFKACWSQTSDSYSITNYSEKNADRQLHESCLSRVSLMKVDVLICHPLRQSCL